MTVAGLLRGARRAGSPAAWLIPKRGSLQGRRHTRASTRIHGRELDQEAAFRPCVCGEPRDRRSRPRRNHRRAPPNGLGRSVSADLLRVWPLDAAASGTAAFLAGHRIAPQGRQHMACEDGHVRCAEPTPGRFLSGSPVRAPHSVRPRRRPARCNSPNSPGIAGRPRPCTTSGTSRAARTPREYAPVPCPVPRPPCLMAALCNPAIGRMR